MRQRGRRSVDWCLRQHWQLTRRTPAFRSTAERWLYQPLVCVTINSMDQQDIIQTLSGLPVGDVRYFSSIGSTNDEAIAWAAKGVPDLSVIIADEQTAGRGRLDRPWFTPPATALAFSLILRPRADE